MVVLLSFLYQAAFAACRYIVGEPFWKCNDLFKKICVCRRNRRLKHAWPVMRAVMITHPKKI
ncbi:hypothetical protein P6F34_gp40 [Pseudomonas phage MiCath]|uniref:Uncharacterized protein n=1 Tax=Pseudomonas phage MiCath TaxID=3003729 RepID=A0AAF0AFX0_9CAUD|nr:hypothetical protein P6F34_gp40 [Pseudomonas phage MiCath]WAX22392.1 hypothetical protein [Pseudomonas phage MiCath]